MTREREFNYPRRQGRIVVAGGDGGGAPVAGACECFCLEEGNVVVNGVETTSKWSVQMGVEVFRQTYGSITFPAGSYELTLDEGGASWSLDIGDLLTAEYLSGADATADTVMDGTLTMSFDSYGNLNVQLCVDGTVPEE